MEKIKINNQDYILDVDKAKELGILKEKETEYIDLGLPSGTLWASENADDEYYTFDKAVETFGKRLPTRAQFCELTDYTTQEWDEEKKGMWFIGKNGNKVFFPASGRLSSGSGAVNNVGSYGYYWSSSPNLASYACNLLFNSSRVGPSNGNSRAYSLPVRCVKDNFK